MHQQETTTRDDRQYIDTHYHLLEADKLQYDPSLDIFLKENYSASRFEADSSSTPVRYGIVVEAADNVEDELDYAIKQSCTHKSIVGVVAGIHLDDPQFESKLNKYNSGRGKRMLVGVRNWKLRGEEFYESEALWPALRILQSKGLVLDLSLRPHDLQRITVIPERFPNLKIVINHLGMPNTEPQLVKEWTEGMANIAKYPNVFVKVSGFVSKDGWNVSLRTSGRKFEPTYEQFQPKVDHVISVFGPDRVMYASDWPVDLIGFNTYTDIYNFVNTIVKLEDTEKDKLFRLNAIRIYGLTLE